MDDDGRQGSMWLTSALPQSLGLWCCEDGPFWTVKTLLYENWEYKLPDGLTRESTADGKIEMEIKFEMNRYIGQPKNMFIWELEFNETVRHRPLPYSILAK